MATNDLNPKPPFKKGTLKPLNDAQLGRRAQVADDDAQAVLDQSGPQLRALLEAVPAPETK